MMSKNILYIKNMVCPRCVLAVEGVLKEMQVPYFKVELGRVQLDSTLNDQQKNVFEEKLEAFGFELLEPGKSTLISKIKTLIIKQVHHKEKALTENFSTFLAEQLHHEYSYMSRLFSSVEGVTIEKFIAAQKIEKVKELLFYNELTLSEIAFQMDYSSVAYLSTQFKKETGMTPTAFKKMHKPGHRNLDSI
ncbi:AraC family transcriptional regulator [Flammeovirgaceae bacterium SG7u.111]|nr:AraC family transcriptional regulator [Flammeovirgaceae bacterium SG7u.132]WPO38695.1 AraC family transcriptional regulator [Flammeovirgaceae bacterium SG7u.111]